MDDSQKVIGQSPEARISFYLKRIATGPKMSKPLSIEQAQDGMRLILEGAVSDVQAAIFLVALRMKRETDDENRGILSALRESTLWANASVPELVEIADPYDGFNRHPPLSPFLLPLLAACGLPAISHGCESVGPKFGVTHRQIFQQAGVPVDLTPIAAAARLADPEIGWAYLDQSIFCPSLYRLIELRRLMVKRPCIATLEKMCGPVRARKNYLFIGYVHPGYEWEIPLSARHAGYHGCCAVKGVEGGILLPMNKEITAYVYTDGGEIGPVLLNPKEAGVETTIRSIPIPTKTTSESLPFVIPLPFPTGVVDSPPAEGLFAAVGQRPKMENHQLAAASVQIGMEALSGKGPSRDALVFSASALLYAIRKFPCLSDAASVVCDRIDSGAALSHFKKGRE
jgi:anthranilate phosphoribosyltransferase